MGCLWSKTKSDLTDADRTKSSALPSDEMALKPYEQDKLQCTVRKPLHLYRAQDVAEQLTEIDSKLLGNIRPDEIEGEAWTKKQKYLTPTNLQNERSPNIMAMVQAFNRLALLIPTEILGETTPQGRANVISKYIKIASECYKLKNFNSLKSVLAGLQCTPIFRLTKTWNKVPYNRLREFKRLTTLMSEVNNWQLYRNQLNKHLASNTPCIAFLGVYLTEVIHHGCYQGILTNRSAVSSCSAPSYTDAAEGIDGSNNPKALLERYKASASKCISLRRCSPELQCLLHEGGGAPYSESLNYKISLEREP
eukprot:Em0003g1208a